MTLTPPHSCDFLRYMAAFHGAICRVAQTVRGSLTVMMAYLGIPPVYLRMAWRGDSDNPALPPVLTLAEQVWAGRPDSLAGVEQ